MEFVITCHFKYIYPYKILVQQFLGVSFLRIEYIWTYYMKENTIKKIL
jgi:hypothetical protein